MNIKNVVKKTIENWINKELEIDPRGCMGVLYEPERPISKPEDTEK